MRVDVAFSRELFERERNRVAAQAEAFCELPGPEQTRSSAKRAALDAFPQPARELNCEILAGQTVREERLEREWLLHFMR